MSGVTPTPEFPRDCQAGCRHYTGGEVRHHPHCVFYPESFSKMYDDMNVLLVKLYNTGYHAGHEDTVEGRYTDVLPSDMSTFHADIVQDWLADELMEGTL